MPPKDGGKIAKNNDSAKDSPADVVGNLLSYDTEGSSMKWSRRADCQRKHKLCWNGCLLNQCNLGKSGR